MKYNAMNILTGILILFIVSYLLVALFNFLYLRYAAKKEVKTAKLILSAGVITLVWLLATVLAIWVTASLNVIFFSLFALVIIFSFNYFMAEKLVGVSGKHRIIYSILLAVLFNPGWLVLMGLL